MSIKSKRFVFAVLTGMIVGLLITILARAACSGIIIGVFVAAFLAHVASPKDGTIIGIIVLVPIEIYVVLQVTSQGLSDYPVVRLGNLLGVLLILVLFSGVGALYGLILGKLFQLIKARLTIS
jgi:hypothetical protein